MSISFSKDACRTVLEKAGIPLLPRAHTTLARILNRQIPILIAQLDRAPIPKSADTRQNAASIRGRLRRVTDALGCDITLSGEITISESHAWPQAIEQISNYLPGRTRKDIDGRLRKMAQDISWLNQELSELTLVLTGHPGVPRSSSNSNTRKAATRMLVTELVHAADDLFGVPLTVINNTAARGGEVRGPAVVYLAETLLLVRETLRDSGQTRLS
jgi:hypothetical protein